jgi:GH18 family chitinase
MWMTFICGTQSARGQQAAGMGSFRVAGYLPDYRFSNINFDAIKGLTDLIIFSAEPGPDGTLNTSRIKACPWDSLLRFKTENRIRLILTIGGWERSEHFAKVAKSPKDRKAFVDTVVAFTLARRLDGIDIDWEHPKDASEEQAYAALLTDLKDAFKPHGLLLTVTIAAWQHLPKGAVAAVDGVQVMAYDHDKEHSTFDGANKDVRTLLDAGIPAKKIILGLPFYGRDIKTRDAETYGAIAARHRPEPAVDQVGSMYFNGIATITRKVNHAVQMRLGGVMIWEIGQDATGENSLLKAVLKSISSQFN